MSLRTVGSLIEVVSVLAGDPGGLHSGCWMTPRDENSKNRIAIYSWNASSSACSPYKGMYR